MGRESGGLSTQPSFAPAGALPSPMPTLPSLVQSHLRCQAPASTSSGKPARCTPELSKGGAGGAAQGLVSVPPTAGQDWGEQQERAVLLPTQAHRWSLPESETESSEPDQGSRVMRGVTQPGQVGKGQQRCTLCTCPHRVPTAQG